MRIMKIRKGVSGVIGALFFTLIALTAFAVAYRSMAVISDYRAAIATELHRERERALERLSVATIRVVNKTVAAIEVANEGAVLVEVAAVYVHILPNNTLRVIEYPPDRHISIRERVVIHVDTGVDLVAVPHRIFIASARGNVAGLAPPAVVPGPLQPTYPVLNHWATGMAEPVGDLRIITPPKPRRLIFSIRVRNIGARAISIQPESHVFPVKNGKGEPFFIVDAASNLDRLVAFRELLIPPGGEAVLLFASKKPMGAEFQKMLEEGLYVAAISVLFTEEGVAGLQGFVAHVPLSVVKPE